MVIGVNARRLEGQRLGVARYIEYLLRHWGGMLAPDERVDLFVRQPLDPALEVPANVRARHLRPSLTGLAWENSVLRYAARRADVLFCPSYTAPLGPALRAPTVVVVHSVPEVTEDDRRGLQSRLLAKTYRRSARRATTVLVPTEATAADVERYYGVERERMRVVPLGVDEVFRPLERNGNLRAVRERYFGEDVPFVLFVGKMSRRRNIPTLLQAFRRLKQEGLPHRLLLLGPNHEKLPLDSLLERLELRDDVVQDDGRVARHSDLVPIYNAAAAFVHPTSNDSFSFPVLEAFSCGLPVVTVNRGGVGEIAHGYARTIEEPTVGTLAEALLDVLTHPDVQAELRLKGFRRADDFRWSHTAAETLGALREAAGR